MDAFCTGAETLQSVHTANDCTVIYMQLYPAQKGITNVKDDQRGRGEQSCPAQYKTTVPSVQPANYAVPNPQFTPDAAPL